MAHVLKCGVCGILNSEENPIAKTNGELILYGKERLYETGRSEQSVVELTINLKDKYHYGEVCANCINDFISSQFYAIAEMMAPYRPVRTSGFIQGAVVPEDMTADERKALSVLSRRLLRA